MQHATKDSRRILIIAFVWTATVEPSVKQVNSHSQIYKRYQCCISTIHTIISVVWWWCWCPDQCIFYKELVISVRNWCTWNEFDEWYDFGHKLKYMYDLLDKWCAVIFLERLGTLTAFDWIKLLNTNNWIRK